MDNPEKLRLIAKEDEWVSPEYVAETMVSLVEGEALEVSAAGTRNSGLGMGDQEQETMMVKVYGGMIVEVAKGKRRIVEQFNDPGPIGNGNTVGNVGLAVDEILAMLEEGGY